MTLPSFSLESPLWKDNLFRIAGVDEAGRGAWAGPLFAAAVVFPPRVRLPMRLADSKALSPAGREERAAMIKEKALFWAVAAAEAELIETDGISAATGAAMAAALKALGEWPEFVLVDYFGIPAWPAAEQQAVKFGDQRSNSIAAASILAKVARDARMRELGEQYPQYGFAAHKGYGTTLHRQRIEEHGFCEHHRLSFIPEDLL